MTDNNPLVGKKTAGSAGLVVIEGPQDKVSIWLGPNERFVVFMRDKAPILIGHSSPGTYEIDGTDFAGEDYPIGILGVPLDVINNFSQIPAFVVNKILDKIKACVEDGSYHLEPMSFNYKTSDDKLETFKFGMLDIPKPEPEIITPKVKH